MRNKYIWKETSKESKTREKNKKRKKNLNENENIYQVHRITGF